MKSNRPSTIQQCAFGVFGFLMFLVVVNHAGAAGLSQRFANTTLTLPQQPLAIGYQFVNAFGANTFSQPLCIVTPPGETNRVFILEKGGRIQVVTNIGGASPTKSLYMDLTAQISTSGEQGLLGLAFHPNFQVNGYFFVYRSVNTNGAVYERLARFQAVPPGAATASPATEVVLFDQQDLADNHNGGDLHFGADGYLYISLGDGGQQNDALNNTQTIRKGFHSGILRIDVDNQPGNLPPAPPSTISQLIVSANYSVPADNPWVTNSFIYERNTTVPTNSIRSEFWVVGLRNPWRFSFDPVTSWLWEGDVGGDLREEVNILVKGGDYGWAYREGTIAGPKSAQAPPGFTGINPIYQYSHGTTATNAGNSITGGLVYRGNGLPELTGAYVFADYVSGWIWALRYDGSTISDFHNLLQSGIALREAGIVAFGTDPRNGDILLADIDSGLVRRLISASTGAPLPPTLADAGAFSDLQALTPQAGIVPYDVNVPYWADNAIASRWFSIPNPNLNILWSPSNNWSFPTGTVWIQHLELVTNTVTQERTRLETRFLVRNTNGVYGATYRWGEDPNDATLVDAGGANAAFVISGVGGILRTQNWYYPSRADCLRCHSTVAGFAVGFHTAQLNRDHAYTNFPGATGETDSQLRALSAVGYFNVAVPQPQPENLPALANWDNSSATLEWRSRSFLGANCVQCHQPGGLAQGFWDARYSVPTAQAGLIWGAVNNSFGNPNARVIAPQSLANSMLYQRIGGFVGTRMPPLATSVLDTNDMNLIAQWIGALTDPQPFVKAFTLISTGAVWRYNDTGADLGTTWHGVNYPDDTWPSGPAQLGFGDGDEATVIATNRQITSYFRRAFTLPATNGFTSLTVRLMRDDGGVVYLNDNEIFRSNMPTGTIGYLTLASSATVIPDENTFFSTNGTASLLVPGTNVVAVEIHQNDVASADLSFDLQLLGTASGIAPTLRIAPGPGADQFTISWPGDPGFFDLYTSPTITPPVTWARAGAADFVNGQWTFTISSPSGTQFYRLQNR